MGIRYISPFHQYTGESGEILKQGKLEFFKSNTRTQSPIFPSVVGQASGDNVNPIILDDNGRAQDGTFLANVFMLDEAYKIVISDSDDNLIDEIDPYIPPSATGDNYIPGSVYNLNDTVRSSDNTFVYVSLKDDNTTDPTLSANPDWTQYRIFRAWNQDEAYAGGMIAIYTDNNLYTSLEDNNLNNIPPQSGVWKPAKTSYKGGLLQLGENDEGLQVVSGVGFQPSSVTLSGWCGDTAETFVSGAFGFELDTNPTQKTSVGFSAEDNNDAASPVSNEQDALFLSTPSLSPSVAIDVDSFDADGFTLDVSTHTGIEETNIIWRAQR